MSLSLLPILPYASLEPRIERSQSSSRSGKRLLNIVEYADPVWIVDVETAPVYRDELRRLKAWIASRRGSLRSVLYRAHGYNGPQSHRANLGPAAQRATITHVTERNKISLTGVAEGLIMLPGDYVSIVHPSGLTIGIVSNRFVANVNDFIEIEPQLPIGFNPVGGFVYFDRIQTTMRIVPDSWSENDEDGKVMSSVSFQMVEINQSVNLNEVI